MNRKKVIVGMSGGVDSSVAAYLLKEQGYDVTGATMLLWTENTAAEMSGAKEPSDVFAAAEDARRVAEQLSIPHVVIDFREEFRKYVVTYFTEEYLRGRTPNPCNTCNRYVKWEALLKGARELGADYVATGHYARIDTLPNGRLAIRNAAAVAKDQTYALYMLTQEQLARTIFPLGAYEKSKIREIASGIGPDVADKPDSQDICFIPDGDYGAFLEREAGKRLPGDGNYVTKDGQILGQHKGTPHYTIGQRKGLGIAMGHPVFVTALDTEKNEVVIGESEDLFTDTLVCDHLHFMGIEDIAAGSPLICTAKIRYAHKGAACRVERIDAEKLRVTFDQPVRAVTPGQAVVFYDGEYVLGGGLILR